MAIEATEAIALMGYDLSKFEDIDSFKAEVEKDWVKTADAHLNKDIAGRIFAKQNNTFRSTLSKIGKELDIEGVDFDTIDPLEGIKALSENFAKQKASYEKSKGDGSTNAEVLEEKRKYEEAKKKIETLQTALNTTSAEFGEYKNTVAQKEAAAKLEGIRSRGMKAIPFASTVTGLAKTGFDTLVRKEVLIAFDDEGVEYATDSDGNRIKHPSKANSFLTYDEAVMAIAEREGLLEETPSPKPVGKTISTLASFGKQEAQKSEAPRQVRKLATR